MVPDCCFDIAQVLFILAIESRLFLSIKFGGPVTFHYQAFYLH